MAVCLGPVTRQRSWLPCVAKLPSLWSLRGYRLTGWLYFMSGASDWLAVQVVAYNGWEYTVLERELGGAPRPLAQDAGHGEPQPHAKGAWA